MAVVTQDAPPSGQRSSGRSSVSRPRLARRSRPARPTGHPGLGNGWALPALGAAVIAGVTALLWFAGGGLSQLGEQDGVWLAVGQTAGLTATLAALAGIVLVARPAWLERHAGLDVLWRWHRLAGITTVVALSVHVLASSVGFAGGRIGQAIPEIIALMGSTSWMVAAVVGALLFFTVALTSWRRVREHMSYETWLGVHFAGYLAVLLGFGHQLTIGSSLGGRAVMRWWWIGLAIATLGIVLWSRVGGLVTAVVAGRGVVTARYPAAKDSTALEVRTRNTLLAGAQAGQFFVLRFVTRDLWWQAHPISLSASPTDRTLRFTIRQLGDGSALMRQVAPGTRVVLEGPYGRFTAARAEGRPVLLVGGGVGLAPLRAILADCHPAQRPVVVARVRDRSELPHDAEFSALLAQRNGRMYVLDGPRSRWNGGEPFAPAIWRTAVPDLAEREAFVCGPASLERAVERGLRGAGVPVTRIHTEEFGVLP